MSALLGRWWRAAGAGRGWQAASNPPSRSCRDGTSFRVPKLPPLLLQRQIRSVHLCYPLFEYLLRFLCGLWGRKAPDGKRDVKYLLRASRTPVGLLLHLILGLIILCIGIYAEVERQKHKTLEGIFLAPAIVLLLLGFTMFCVSFVGMVGSLRDNRTLLKTFFWVLLIIFLMELLLICIEIIFENKMNAVFHSNIQEGIRHYYDDLDFKNILDFVQEKFSCCGGDEYRDWEVNLYHSCNGSGPLACGVPYTCCIRKVPGEVTNTLCGYRTLDKERLELLNVIHVRGCIHAVGLWLKDNFEATLGIICSMLLPQVVGLVMAWLYWQKLNEMYSKLDTVDFKMLEIRDFSFGAVDLSGAGWCWCLPKEGGYIPINVMEEEDKEEEGAI